MLWDFHDLLFHTRSTEGRQANPLGAPLPMPSIDCAAARGAAALAWQQDRSAQILAPSPNRTSPFAKLLRERHSMRDFDDEHPITLAELARFLDTTARVQSEWNSELDFDGDGPDVDLHHAALSVRRQRL